MVFERGSGSTLIDVEGNSWIDLTCGYSASNFGHAYEPLIAVAQNQLQKLTHLTSDPHVGRIQLAEKLIALFDRTASAIPRELRTLESGLKYSARKVVFNATGSRAIETAWKAVSEKRPGQLLVLEPSFHGRSISTAALSTTTRASISNCMLDMVAQWPMSKSPYVEFSSSPVSTDQVGNELLSWLRDDAENFCGVLVEPVATARGYLLPRVEFFHRLRKVTRELGLPIICDEIQAGLGRCAPLSFSLSQGWEPDLIVLGKSLGGGITPISVVVGRADYLDAIPEGAESETFAATPFASAIGSEVLELLTDERLFEQGVEAAENIKCMVSENWPECTVESFGAVCVAEFAANHEPPLLETAVNRARARSEQCANNHIKVQLSGPLRTRIVMLPALTITKDELDQLHRRLSDSIHSL